LADQRGGAAGLTGRPQTRAQRLAQPDQRQPDQGRLGPADAPKEEAEHGHGGGGGGMGGMGDMGM
jgi:hypothetical protein